MCVCAEYGSCYGDRGVFCGWGMRIAFVPDDEPYEVKEPDEKT